MLAENRCRTEHSVRDHSGEAEQLRPDGADVDRVMVTADGGIAADCAGLMRRTELGGGSFGLCFGGSGFGSPDRLVRCWRRNVET